MTARVFIDGEAGTTGLHIRSKLEAIEHQLENRNDIQLIRIPAKWRKERDARAEALNKADAVILCLPDDAAREAVSLIQSNRVRIIDASSAHRTSPGWVYGFPELSADQHSVIAEARQVSNPGCYPTGAIALLRPLTEAKLLPRDWPVTINAVSGYSGGGKAMISEFQSAESVPYHIYAMGLEHKHVEEMRVHSGLAHPPLFAPSVGRYFQGMIVEIPLQLWAMPGEPKLKQLHAVFADRYAKERFIEVASLEEAANLKTLSPEALNNTNDVKLFVFGNENRGQARLVALLDNLGKGASGAAVQNLNLMLGLEEGTGL